MCQFVSYGNKMSCFLRLHFAWCFDFLMVFRSNKFIVMNLLDPKFLKKSYVTGGVTYVYMWMLRYEATTDFFPD